jgi:hypothetical protein
MILAVNGSAKKVLPWDRNTGKLAVLCARYDSDNTVLLQGD